MMTEIDTPGESEEVLVRRVIAIAGLDTTFQKQSLCHVEGGENRVAVHEHSHCPLAEEDSISPPVPVI